MPHPVIPCYCGELCVYEGPDCWGTVQAIEEEGGEDWYFVHACEGHEDVYHGGSYTVPVSSIISSERC